jgi:LAGLIDADG DNA endonuclease family
LKEILVGLLLGDACARRPKPTVNTRLQFAQSVIHEDYKLHLYELFKDYCKSAPKLVTPMAHKKAVKFIPISNLRLEHYRASIIIMIFFIRAELKSFLLT